MKYYLTINTWNPKYYIYDPIKKIDLKIGKNQSIITKKIKKEFVTQLLIVRKKKKDNHTVDYSINLKTDINKIFKMKLKA